MVDAPQSEIAVTETPAVIPAAPAVETPVITPATETPVPATVETPASGETPSAPLPIENILGDAKPDAPKAETISSDKPVTETPPEVKAELPVYESFALPDGISLDKEPMDAFTKMLGEVEMSKLDHKGYQVFGQKLVDLAVKNTQDSITRLNDYYANFHENQKKEWMESFKKDPEMGGDNLQQTVGMLRDVVDNYGGSPEQITEFRQVMKDTGVGNHPAVTRILYNMAQKINKYTTEADNGNGGTNRMVPGAKPAPTKVKDYQKFYGGSTS